VQVLSPSTADLIRQFQEHAEIVDQEGFVEGLVARIESAVEASNQDHQLVMANGKLHKPAFARLIQQYLSNQTVWKRPTNIRFQSAQTKRDTQQQRHETKSDGVYDNAMESTADNDAAQDNEIDVEYLPSFIRIFIEQMELDDRIDYMLMSDGKLNRPALEQMVHQYLEETTDRCLRDHAVDAEWLESKSQGENDKALLSGAKPTFFGRLQNAKAQLQSFRLGPDEAGLKMSESKASEDPSEAGLPVTSSFGSKLTGSVSHKVSELFSSLSSRHHNHATSEEVAYSAFRQAQDQRRQSLGAAAMDDGSSQSSYRILPAGIRKVVQGFRRGKLFVTGNREGEDTFSEHKHESGDYLAQDDNDDSAYDCDTSGILSSLEDRPGEPEFSQDDVRNLQSALLSGGAQPSDQSVIYADGSLVSGDNGMNAEMVASLMLSPTLLTKRHQQAIRAVENRKWDHVKYLLSANPWLAEMADVNTNQYVIHKLSFYGAGLLGVDHTTGEVISIRYPPSPQQLNVDLVQMFPSSVHKFDKDGNLPLHMAAAAANYAMIELLGERFASGASVRNEDGMLPLHLVLIACASPLAATYGTEVDATDIVKAVTRLFPAALGIADNEGNLPIHTAASVLQGEDGAAILYFLLDETQRQMTGETALRFNGNRRRVEEIDDGDLEMDSTATRADSSTRQDDDFASCLVVRNERALTPLALAISSRAGWEVIEALCCSKTCLEAFDSEENSALHLLLSDPYKDPIAALTLLKLVPEAASLRNADGMLPIEVSLLSRSVIVQSCKFSKVLILSQPCRWRAYKCFLAR
jgi:ankyrin repeat protein